MAQKQMEPKEKIAAAAKAVTARSDEVERNRDLMRRSLPDLFLLPDGFDQRTTASLVLAAFQQQSADAPVDTWAREGGYAEGRSFEDLVLPPTCARGAGFWARSAF
jgi:hypothetical protein